MEHDKKRPRYFRKDSIDYPRTDEAKGSVLSRMCEIESLIDQLITLHIKPSNTWLFSIILNGSVMDMGGKIKVLNNINCFTNKEIGNLRRLISVRNGFAHVEIKHSINIIDAPNVKISDGGVSHVIEVMNAEGKLKTVEASKLFEEFSTLFKEMRDILINIIEMQNLQK